MLYIMKALKVIHSEILPMRGYKAMLLGRYLTVRKGNTMSAVDMRHEEIHLAQERELLYVGFYLLYVLLFLVLLLWHFNWHKAYRAIPFEHEAYSHQAEIDYLQRRRRFAWCRNMR